MIPRSFKAQKKPAVFILQTFSYFSYVIFHLMQLMITDYIWF